MIWFEINDDEITLRDAFSGTAFAREYGMWGLRVGDRWTIDQAFKLMTGMSSEEWQNLSIKTDQDFYDLCDRFGLCYMKDGKICCRGKEYDKWGKEFIEV